MGALSQSDSARLTVFNGLLLAAHLAALRDSCRLATQQNTRFEYCAYYAYCFDARPLISQIGGRLPPIPTMKLAPNRLDPSELSAEDFLEVERLLGEVFGSQQRPALVNAEGKRLELPQPVFDMLVHVLRSIRERRAVIMMPEDESFTSQAAADYLGMSRPFLISLLDKGEIPFHYVGSHRRIVFKHLLDYERNRDSVRRDAMGQLSKTVMEAGLDDASYTGE